MDFLFYFVLNFFVFLLVYLQCRARLLGVGCACTCMHTHAHMLHSLHRGRQLHLPSHTTRCLSLSHSVALFVLPTRLDKSQSPRTASTVALVHRPGAQRGSNSAQRITIESLHFVLPTFPHAVFLRSRDGQTDGHGSVNSAVDPDQEYILFWGF